MDINIKIIIFLYIVSYVLTYYYIKYHDKRMFPMLERDWIDVWIGLSISMGSILTFIIIFTIDCIKNKKVPKWL